MKSDKLSQSGLSLSGGQQQRLCIARAIAVKPEVILMDEPASALDPIATLRIEELIQEIKQNYTIIIVTHNMQQAARASDFTAFSASMIIAPVCSWSLVKRIRFSRIHTTRRLNSISPVGLVVHV